MVKAAQADAPLWGALKKNEGAADPTMVEFVRALEVTLSARIAEAKAPSSAGNQPTPGG